MTANTTTMIANIPEIILLCHDADFVTAFQTAQQQHWPELPSKLTITPINSRLNRLDPHPRDDYEALMRAVQLELYEKWRGFGTPTGGEGGMHACAVSYPTGAEFTALCLAGCLFNYAGADECRLGPGGCL
ncbi:hypothetical protein V6Z88_003734 [Aspergillus fumigatus]|nr:hypothetical protein KXX44_001816 [Aspergillus fumigatus]KAH3034963.1 hypothetical protein KXW01_005898 [Aspergillus fumigatus]KAH3313193.1 hypothetical protein KXW17_005711 [Aspergillus fumigatus]